MQRFYSDGAEGTSIRGVGASWVSVGADAELGVSTIRLLVGKTHKWECDEGGDRV